MRVSSDLGSLQDLIFEFEVILEPDTRENLFLGQSLILKQQMYEIVLRKKY